MSRMNLEDPKLYDPVFAKGLKYGVHVETKAAAWTVDRDQAPLAFITLTGSGQNMTMPPAEQGLCFRVRNTSASALTITVKDPAAVTIGTIVQNGLAFIYSDGVNWFLT